MRHAASLAAALLLAAACGPIPPRGGDGRPALAVTDVLRTGGEGFARALLPRPFSFPADHGSHAGFRTEWWYFTGNLTTAEGRRFGYQLTFFRNQLRAEPVARPSAWAAYEVFMAHFALTDVDAGRFYAAERFRRAAQGLAGATAEPFRVWLEPWSAAALTGEIPPLRLVAADGEVALDLELTPGKPLVLQGEAGLSRKGAEPGNASYYYSFTRLPTAGSIEVGGERFAVSGASWMDREWSTSSLSTGQVGWDWFALHLNDGRDLMVYQLRRGDGTADPASRGALIDAGGGSVPLLPEEVALRTRSTWRSPTGAIYPSRWHLSLPNHGLDLELTPLLDDQEHRGAFAYWEGAVEVRGINSGQPVAGVGYIEMTGYGDAGVGWGAEALNRHSFHP